MIAARDAGARGVGEPFSAGLADAAPVGETLDDLAHLAALGARPVTRGLVTAQTHATVIEDHHQRPVTATTPAEERREIRVRGVQRTVEACERGRADGGVSEQVDAVVDDIEDQLQLVGRRLRTCLKSDLHRGWCDCGGERADN
ncbi:MAG: hypothetical protein CVT61_02415 [Actinobacteria bacterium HGW-Actinobacteria-11]|nr:MAG: hypothetical protein CVT61_02415 [Actinobacteria bacterium HGW-Actinobacteria-11]